MSRIAAIVMLFSAIFVYGSGITAFAAVDLDVTLVPPEDSVTNGGNCPVDLQIVTKSANGYVEMVINIEYDADLLALAAPVNQNGYRVTGSRGQLTLTYYDPTGTKTPTPIGNTEIITINFIVLENAPDTTTKIRATIDRAYNVKGQPVIWTPIYDKEIEIVRINNDTASSETASEEDSSQFVVGDHANTVSRSTTGGGGGGKVAAVLFGAAVVFGAGMVAGYILCMRKYGIEGGRPREDDAADGYYDREDGGGYAKKESRRKRRQDEDYADYDAYDKYTGNNDDGYYTKPGDEYTVTDEEDYFASVPAGSGTSGNYLNILNGSAPIGTRSLDPTDFGSILDGGKKDTRSDEDDYPILFQQAGGRSGGARQTSGERPVFDESQDTLFGRFSANVERNVDDGYGGPSHSKDRSERARRNR